MPCQISSRRVLMAQSMISLMFRYDQQPLLANCHRALLKQNQLANVVIAVTNNF